MANNPVEEYMESKEGDMCPACGGTGAHFFGCTFGFDANGKLIDGSALEVDAALYGFTATKDGERVDPRDIRPMK